METVRDFIFLGFKITADGDCSHEIKRCLLLGRKTMTNLDSIVKIRDITLPTKVHLAKAMVFPVVMCGCESWTIKKAEHQTDAFELWCWRRLFRIPRTARRSNQSILKEISPEYSLEGLMLKLQYFGQLMERTDSLEKTLMLGKIKGGRRGRQRMRWLDGITDLMEMSLSKLRKALLSLWHRANQLSSLDFQFLFCVMRGLENMIKIPFRSRSCFTFRSTKPHICLFISIIGVCTICFLKNIFLKRFSFKHFFPRVSWFFYRVLLYVAEQWLFSYWLNDLFSPGFLRGLK